jgi:hypothetical protein
MEHDPEPREIPKEPERESARRVKYAYWPEDTWLEPYWPIASSLEFAAVLKRKRRRRGGKP